VYFFIRTPRVPVQFTHLTHLNKTAFYGMLHVYRVLLGRPKHANGVSPFQERYGKVLSLHILNALLSTIILSYIPLL